MSGPLNDNWYYSKSGTGQPVGPLSWEQLCIAAQNGVLLPADAVWNPGLPDWVPASDVAGLFRQQPLATGARPSTPVTPPSTNTASVAPSARGRRSNLLAWLIPVIALVIVGAGFGTYFGFFYDNHGSSSAGGAGGTASGGPATGGGTETTEGGAANAGLGKAEFKVPEAASIVATTAWGEVPANQLIVVLKEGADYKDAERVAEAVGGSVVGEVEFINLYQIEFPGSTEAELQAAVNTAQADENVELATASQQVYPDIEIWGVRQDPLNDPAYQGNFGKGYGLIGVDKAWKYIKGSGMHLWGVTVGVVDSGLYTPSGEFEGDVNISYPTQGNGSRTTPVKEKTATGAQYEDPDGSHGTAVAGLIGADAENGGQAGIASVLGNKLTLSVTDHRSPPYGDKGVPADPNDPTVVTYPSGNSYAIGSMVAILKQVEAGAKVINCSWGNRADNPNAVLASAYKKFFEKMSREHPDVLFVCSAGNDGKARNGAERFPSGLSLPNMITVGNVLNDGSVAPSSNKKNDTPGQEYEVTLAAPGDEAVRSVGKDGTVHAGQEEVAPGWWTSGGTSMAAPQVSAAAALLLSINPDLSAGQIKELLTSTARPGPEELGGKILAIDAAVLEVINQQREKQGFPRVTAEELENGAVIDAVAISIDSEPNTYTIKGIVKVLPSVEGADILISGTSGVEISGETTQHLDQAGEVVWEKVYIPGDMAVITVTRKDNDASSVITFEKFDLNGIWTGSLTITDIIFDEAGEQAAAEQGCDLRQVIAALKGQTFPNRLDISVDESGNGTAIMLLDFSALDEDASAEPMNWAVSYAGSTVNFQSESSSAGAGSMTATVARNGETLVMEGTLVLADQGITMTASWTVTKQ